MNIKANHRYRFTRRKNGVIDQTFLGTVKSVEERSTFWYIGYTPDDKRLGKFGYLKIKKDGLFKVVNYELDEVHGYEK